MSTTCPNCTLHLAVTAADLRVGQGYVRCGRCERVFNALISLSEDPEVPPQKGDVATGTTTLPALQVGEESEPTSGQELVAAAFESPAPTAEASEQGDVDVVETLATGTFETIVLEGDGVLQTEELVDEADMAEALQEIADQIGAAELNHLKEHLQGAQEYAAPDTAPVEEATPAPVPPYAGPVASRHDTPAFEEMFEERPAPHRGWTLGAVALGLLLLGQIIHHHRQGLAEVGWTHGLLAPLYGLFGATLEPRWDLAAYDVRQLGGESLPALPEHILLRASVLNRSLHAQPPPVLRVTLQDRFGNPLARHDVAPQDYLPGAPPARLAPDQRLDAELVLADPGNLAVGFELDACLPDTASRTHCASRP